ncbi:MAG: hypothetical protein QM811_21575 [Pirellulales bacterium]
MKKFIAAVVLTSGLCFAPAANAAEPVRNRAADAQDVASMLGLEQDAYRVLSANEADQIRATGGCCSGSLLNINAAVKANVDVKAAVNAIVKVVSSVKVNANVGVGVKIK